MYNIRLYVYNWLISVLRMRIIVTHLNNSVGPTRTKHKTLFAQVNMVMIPKSV